MDLLPSLRLARLCLLEFWRGLLQWGGLLPFWAGFSQLRPGVMRFRPRWLQVRASGLCRGVLVVLWVGLLGRSANAEQRSALEQSVIAEALDAKGWELEPAPEGKIIEEVGVYVLEVFDRRDPVPNFVNVFHVKSRDWVIEQEVLLNPGDRWEQGRALETERNLRRLRQLSLANMVAAKGRDAQHVKVLVVVKDVWSLRLNSDIQQGKDALDKLLINPAEENFGGIHLTAGLLYLLDRYRQSFGARFVYPRLAMSRYYVATEASFSTNRETGVVEGSSGAFVFQLPLYSRHRHFAYGAEAAWNVSIVRRYVESGDLMYVYTSPTGDVESIPQTYHAEALAAEYWFLHSFGVTHKRDISYGFEVESRVYHPEDLSAYSPEAQEAYVRAVVPVSDRRLSPYVQLRTYRTDYHRVLNLELLGLQEDYRLGYDTMLRMYVASASLGSSRDIIGSVAGLGITLPLGDGLVRAQVKNDLAIGNEGRNEGLLDARVRFALPSLPFGRLHWDALLLTRYENYLNVGPFSLGSDNRLRGYPVGGTRGRDVFVMNTEFRTAPLDILSAQVGLAAFVDIGDAAPSLSELGLLVGTGAGLRILFPQAERSVLRFDVAIPVSPGNEVLPPQFYFTFGQAFSMPGLTAPRVVGGLSPF